ncbi:MAG: aldo/keto reductase, partial [Chloroflexi bacterium]|nr:aldo/keto reductase [Chloroflexota bacterium]
MDPFEKVKIGNTGVEVPRLGLGTAPLSGMVLGEGLYGGTAHEEAVRIIDRARQLGISYVDTAPLYGAGRAEARVGKSAYSARRARRIPIESGLPGARQGNSMTGTADRDSFVISTKVGRVLNPVA